MQLQPELIDLLQMAYSAEKAAAFAYQGHASSLKNSPQVPAINQIEQDEWVHRAEVLAIMNQYHIPVSKWYEFKFHVIGRVIGYSCHVIGWFMPFYFAGRLESGNVCEYFRMRDFFHQKGITKHDEVLNQMGVKEKEHELYFIEVVKDSKLLPFFEKVFSWGKDTSYNTITAEQIKPTAENKTPVIGSAGCKTKHWTTEMHSGCRF